MSDFSDTIKEEPPDVKLTKKGTLIYGEWSREKLIDVLTNKLTRRGKQELPVCDDTLLQVLHCIIHSGIYDEHVLCQIEGRGMSPHNIVKAMKYGLLSLAPEELRYFEDFGVELEDISAQKFNDRLMRKLYVSRLSEAQCRYIVTCGLASQDKCVLYWLFLSGIDVPRILSWPGKITSATPTIIGFLRTFGVSEDTLRHVEENGIDDEAEDMLIDLGYSEYKEMMASEEVICECSLPTLSSAFPDEETAADTASDSSSSETRIPCPTFFKIQSDLAAGTCICHLINSIRLLRKQQDAETPRTSRDYLRQNVMVPLTWAISRALRYQPSDPTHYVAQQLLRWKYGNVSQKEVRDIQEFVASATITTERRRVEERIRKEEDAIKRQNAETLKHILCDVCLERQKLHPVLERCWKCRKVLMSSSAASETQILRREANNFSTSSS